MRMTGLIAMPIRFCMWQITPDTIGSIFEKSKGNVRTAVVKIGLKSCVVAIFLLQKDGLNKGFVVKAIMTVEYLKGSRLNNGDEFVMVLFFQ